MDDLRKINGLNKLENRVVRNALRNRLNNPQSGLLFTNTPEGSDTETPGTYLIQSEITLDTSSVVATVTFTEGTQTVSTTVANGFSGIEAGDFIRPATGGIVYVIQVKVSNTELLLKSAFEGETTTGEAQSFKLKFGRAKLYSYRNTEAVTSFSFDDKTGAYVLESGATRSGPHDTKGDESLVSFRNGVSYYNIPGSNEEGQADINIVGIVSKLLPPASADKLIETFTPVPYPSNLTRPQDLSKLTIGLQGGELVFGEDYLLSYTPNPIFDGYLPLPEEASVANIHLLEDYEYEESVQDFKGIIAPTDSDGAITNVWAESLTVTEGSTELVPNVDFFGDGLSGSVAVFDRKSAEPLVGAVLTDKGLFYSGLSVKKAVVSWEDAIAEDFEGEKDLREGEDFSVNTENGALYLINGIQENETLRISYLVQGASLEESVLVERAPTLRTKAFPIIPGTVFVEVHKGKGSKREILQEGRDYQVMHTNGVISLKEELVSQIDKIQVTYSPALAVEAYVKAFSQSSFAIRVVGLPLAAIDKNTITFPIREDADILGVVLPGGSTFNYRDKVKQHKDAQILFIEEGLPRLAQWGHAFVSFSIETGSLPFAPLVRYSNTLTAGVSSKVWESASPADVPVETGSIIKFYSRTNPAIKEYVRVAQKEDMDGLNTRVTFYQEVGNTVGTLAYMVSDEPLVFLTSVYNAEGSPGGASEITLVGEAPCRPGCLVDVENAGVYYVTSKTSVGGNTLLGVTPPLAKEVKQGVGVLISEKPLYEEGDNILIPAFPLLNTPVPAVIIGYTLEENSPPTRFSISQNQEGLILTKREEGVADVTYGPYTLVGRSLEEVLEDIETGVPGVVFEYLQGADIGDISAESIFPIEQGFNPKQLPYTLRVLPTIIRQQDSTREFLKNETDYVLAEGGVIVLNEGHEEGARYFLSYACPRQVTGAIEVKGKRFVGISQGTQLRVTTDYLARDQFIIETKEEWDYLGAWVLPYLEKKKEALRGPQTQGSAGMSADSSTGLLKGVQEDNFSLVRDLYLTATLLWKIAEYYRTRMQSFSKEFEALKGFVIGNTRGGDIYTWYDVNHQSTFGVSKFFPLNYAKDAPLGDGRFAESYTPFDTCAVYNEGGSGRVYSLYANFDKDTKGVSVGDKIKIQGVTELFEIEEILSSTTVRVSTEIPGAGSTPPPDLDIFEGIPYEVIRQDPWNIGFADDKGNIGAMLISSLGQRVLIQSTDPATKFYIQQSTDDGGTWEVHEVSFENEVMGIVPPLLSRYWSLEEIASKLNEEMAPHFIVTVEEVYKWDGLASEVNKAVSVLWPLEVPDTGTTPGYRRTLVLRSRNPLAWVRVPSWEALDLGFVKGVIYKGSQNSYSCISLYDMERSKRLSVKDTIEGLLAISNKIQRGTQANKDVLTTKVEEAQALANRLYIKLGEAKEGAEELSEETDASSAIGITHAQAVLAEDEYTTRLEGTETVTEGDEDTLEDLEADEGKYICAFEEGVLARDDVQDVISQAYDATGQAVVLFDALNQKTEGYDPRVLFGDKTKDPSVPLGAGGSNLVVFPGYLNNGNIIGSYVPHPYGVWDNTLVGEGYSSSTTEGFRMEDALTVVVTAPGYSLSSNIFSMTITGPSTSQTYSYGLYSTLGNLIAALNSFNSAVQFSTTFPLDTPYGALLTVNKNLTVGSPYIVPFGVKGDMVYYVISDYELMQERDRQQSRANVLGAEKGWLVTREGQLRTQFGEGGERLSYNRKVWMNRLLHKTLGVLSSIVPLKKMIREATGDE